MARIYSPAPAWVRGLTAHFRKFFLKGPCSVNSSCSAATAARSWRRYCPPPGAGPDGRYSEHYRSARADSRAAIVFALGAGFHFVQATGNGEIDRLIVTSLEMQEGTYSLEPQLRPYKTPPPNKLRAPAI